ncbi:hypothetical protein V6N11_066639 [Hibiscus sabdariffa]|uniref:Uncharacterized protein n=2 Tax=Hibiscus sabdariffa TaxID=183260 RepID=A0ABR2DAI2_9ROSI
MELQRGNKVECHGHRALTGGKDKILTLMERDSKEPANTVSCQQKLPKNGLEERENDESRKREILLVHNLTNLLPKAGPYRDLGR